MSFLRIKFYRWFNRVFGLEILHTVKSQRKNIKAVAPYIHPEYLNFKAAAYEAWVKCGGQTAEAHYPIRMFHGLAFRYEMPSLWKHHKEARLRFIEPVSISFDTFPDYALYEVVPFVWDCWPCYFEKMCRWIKKHNVRTAIFTSSQTAERIHARFPEMNVMWCPEAVDTSLYHEGKLLKDRTIDVLEFGRGSNVNVNEDVNVNGNVNINKNGNKRLNYVCTKVDGKFIYDNDQLRAAMGDAKVTITLPRSMTQPEIAGDIETLTQRYWENMLSRMVMVGHAPKELVNLIGYNPVIELDRDHVKEQILEILEHIDDYQELVDRNREMALSIGDWTMRMKEVMEWLKEFGYEV